MKFEELKVGVLVSRIFNWETQLGIITDTRAGNLGQSIEITWSNGHRQKISKLGWTLFLKPEHPKRIQVENGL